MSPTPSKFFLWPFSGATSPACGVVMPMVYANVPLADQLDGVADALLALDPADRVLVVNGADAPVFGHPDDRLGGGKASLWHPHGVESAVRQYLAAGKLLAGRGVRLAGVAFDGESATSVWHKDFDAAAIVADPRYPEAARVYDLPADPWADPMRFNAGADLMAAHEFNRLADAMLRHHPDAWWSNYVDAPVRKADAALVPDLNNWPAYYAPGAAHTYSPCWYGYRNQLTKVGRGYGRGGRPLTSYERVVHDFNQVLAALAADPTGRFAVWTGAREQGAYTAAHAVEVAVLSLLAGRGRGLHWAGDGLSADAYAADAARLDRAAAVCDSITGGRRIVGPLPIELRGDEGNGFAAAVRRDDGVIAGRFVWSDTAAADKAHRVSVARGHKLRLRRAGDDAGTSFRLEAA